MKRATATVTALEVEEGNEIASHGGYLGIVETNEQDGDDSSRRIIQLVNGRVLKLGASQGLYLLG